MNNIHWFKSHLFAHSIAGEFFVRPFSNDNVGSRMKMPCFRGPTVPSRALLEFWRSCPSKTRQKKPRSLPPAQNTMAISVSYNAANLLKPLPDLDISSHRTTRHALHRIHFAGALQPLANFEADVVSTHLGQAWNPRALASSLTGNFLSGSVHEEQVVVSDERGIQGRIEGRAGMVLGAAFRAQDQDLKLGSFKGAQPPYEGYLKAPDFVLVTSVHVAKVIGEAKVPWIAKHCLNILVDEFENGDTEKTLRHALGEYYTLLIGRDSY